MCRYPLICMICEKQITDQEEIGYYDFSYVVVNGRIIKNALEIRCKLCMMKDHPLVNVL